MQLLGSQNISCFPTPYVHTMNHEPSCSTRYLSFFLTYVFTSYNPYKLISISGLFPFITQNIYKDISNNLPYSVKKKNIYNITIVNQLKKYFIQYSLQKGIYSNQEFGILPNMNGRYYIHSFLCRCGTILQYSQINITFRITPYHIVFFQKPDICINKYLLDNLIIKLITPCLFFYILQTNKLQELNHMKQVCELFKCQMAFGGVTFVFIHINYNKI